ncbi:MAG: YceI family protein [Rhodococcus sp. (in: high G+C Gram-positive bacteria)]|uniref:YceI family protein n=1 Tax=Rhodococcus sp. TaxID=1831 RepID=UPI00121071DB|nr:YceI family protein [Rhodococcus sp. (in: high G+C Gram-positive bacteria)]RZL23614.1 MAG: YceI family protein [Rhodococcus sp. (in: high G+C Gram-positive bacteria)]
MNKRWWWVIGSAVAVVLAVILAGPWMYANFIHGDQPDALGLSDDAAPADASAEIDGTWTVGPGSKAGYEVWETLQGQRVFVRGQTEKVSGTATVESEKLTEGTVEVAVATIATDDGRRDFQFSNSVMNASKFPKATFTITEPVDLSTVPADGTITTIPITGELTLKGETRPVTTDFDIRRSAAGIEAAGAIDVTWTDYKIDKPTMFANIIVEDAGQIQFSIILSK